MHKQIGSFCFNHVCTLSPETEISGIVRTFLPQSRYVKRSDLLLHAYGTGPFCKFEVPKDQREAGVYALTVEDEVKYIGECRDLSSRYNKGYGKISPRNCYTRGQPTNCRINNLAYREIEAGKQVNLWFMATPQHKVVEAELLLLLRPGWNRRMTITLEIPDELASELAALFPQEERRRFAVTAIADALTAWSRAVAVRLAESLLA